MLDRLHTRVVDLKTGVDRNAAVNNATLVVELPQPQQPPPSFEELFVAHYHRLRQLCQDNTRKGLSIAALHPGGVSATAFLAAKQDRINSAVVGRHGMADLYLEGEKALSLRHLLVLIHPAESDEDLRFRLVDLRTRLAFEDERGRRLEGMEAEGPVFVRCGPYALFFFPSDSVLPWPDDPADGWDCMPPRIYFDERQAEPDRWRRRGPGSHLRPAAVGDRSARGPIERSHTQVQPKRGARPLTHNLVDREAGEQPMGRLRLSAGRGAQRGEIQLGGAAADDGVLLGRYDRCDNAGLEQLQQHGVSRVHCLVVRIQGRLYAVDTASTNGMVADDDSVRVVPLGGETRWELGDDLVKLTWERYLMED